MAKDFPDIGDYAYKSSAPDETPTPAMVPKLIPSLPASRDTELQPPATGVER
jgi:hypothetical protein